MSPEQASGRPLDSVRSVFLRRHALRDGNRQTRISPHYRNTNIVGDCRRAARPIAALNRGPAPLCWIIERCLAKEPEKRYGSTRDMAHDLAALRDQFSICNSSGRTSVQAIAGTTTESWTGHRAVQPAKRCCCKVRLVTVTGQGELASRLALELLRPGPQFPVAVYFVPLAALSDPALIPSVIAQTLGARGGSQRSGP
jgi:hypothetical protein